MPRLDARGCLGLLLVLSGIRSLASPLRGLLQTLQFNMEAPDSTSLVVSGLPLAISLLEITAGCAFAFRKPMAGWLALTGYLVSLVGFVVLLVFEIRPSDGGGLSLLAMVVEMLGFPIIVVIALAIGRPMGSSARRELGVMLIVYAVSGLLGMAVRMVEQVRIIIEVAPDGSQVLSQLVWIAQYLAVALLQLRAGLQLYRGSEGRALGVYVIAAIVNEVLSMVVYTVVAALRTEDYSGMILASQATGAFVSIAFPLFVWAFVRSQPVVVDAHVPMLPAWSALLYVPFLAVRPVVLDELVTSRRSEPALGDTATLVMCAAFVALAASTALSVVMALREQMSATACAVVATAVGVITTSGLVVIMHTEPVEQIHTGPFLQILATTAVIAWLHRTTQAQVPRAVARRV